MRAAALAVDGGNSKTDVALVAADGRLLGAVRGPTVSHQAVGIEAGMAQLRRLIGMACAAAGLDSGTAGEGGIRPVADVGVFCLAGADFPHDIRLLQGAVRAGGLARDMVVLNDCFAALRAGARQGYGVALICGQGINGAGVAPDGRTRRFAGIGSLSGDWGGAGSVGGAALATTRRASAA